MNPAPATPPNSPPGTPGTPAPAAARRRAIPRAAIERVALVTVILGSFWAIYWSINRLRTLQSQTRALDQRVAKITADIDLMRTRWTDAKAKDVQDRHATIPDSLFEGEPAISGWLEELQKAAVPLALETAVTVGEVTTLTNSVGSISRVRATIDLRQERATPAARPLYHRMLQWVRTVTSQSKRVDLVDFSVTGVTATAGEARAVLELWTREANPTPAETADPDGNPPPPPASAPGSGGKAMEPSKLADALGTAPGVTTAALDSTPSPTAEERP